LRDACRTHGFIAIVAKRGNRECNRGNATLIDNRFASLRWPCTSWFPSGCLLRVVRFHSPSSASRCEKPTSNIYFTELLPFGDAPANSCVFLDKVVNQPAMHGAEARHRTTSTALSNRPSPVPIAFRATSQIKNACNNMLRQHSVETLNVV
jgi:hypothetical protein